MSKYKKLSHVIYRCGYHIVWVPKYRFRILKDVVKELVTADICLLCERKSCEVLELNVRDDHVHLHSLGSSAALDFQVDGYVEGKDSDKSFQELSEPEKETLLGQPFLGAELFREHGRTERGDDPTICRIL